MNPDAAIELSITEGLVDFCKSHDIEQNVSSELIPHYCPVEGPMYIEKGKPCNWCTQYDAVRKPLFLNRYNKYVEKGYGEIRAQQQAQYDVDRWQK